LKIITLFFYLIIQTWCVQASQISADTNAISNESTSAQNISFDDLTIIVFSCDKYQELWAPFFEMFFKRWPSLKTTNSQVPIYLVTNALKHDDPRIISINNQNEKSWSDNALAVLAAVKTKYVLILLEDYFFTRLDEKRLGDIFNFMKSQDVAYCQIACGTDMETRYKAEVYPGIAEKDRYELWRTSLNACFGAQKTWLTH
jgi:hypothetical protein